MILRDAEIADASVIAEVWNAEIRDGVSTFNSVEKTLADVEAMIADRPGAVIVAYDGAAFLGFVTFAQFRGGVGYRFAAEHTVYLTPVARGKGTGRALMGAAEKAAKSLGFQVFVAGISGENTAGQAFHTALGFTEVGRMPDIAMKFERWMSLVLMQKRL